MHRLYLSQIEPFCIDAQAVKNQSLASRNSGKAGDIDRHEKLAEREGLSQLLSEWVADMKAAGLKHIGPSLTALVQVLSTMKHHVVMYLQTWTQVLVITF